MTAAKVEKKKVVATAKGADEEKCIANKESRSKVIEKRILEVFLYL